MLCEQFKVSLDDYLDGLADGNEHLAHEQSCAACRQSLSEARELRARLHNLNVEGPAAGFFEAALKNAVEETAIKEAAAKTNSKKAGSNWSVSLFSAIAAGFLIWFGATFVAEPMATSPFTELPEVTITLAEPRSVNLVFASATSLKGARMSLQLPDGIELEGYGGRQELSWKIDLQEGKNFLKLPIVAYKATDEIIIAKLEHPQGSKTFRLKVNVI